MAADTLASQKNDNMKLLFICTHNRCRSILGEAIANHIGGSTISAASAGSAPQGEVHPLTIKYLAEKGIATNELNSQSWHDFENYEADIVLTMCDNAAKEVCPIWFNDALQINWALPDPSKNNSDEQAQKDAFYHTMDVIEGRIKALLSLNTSTLSASELDAELQSIANRIH